MAKKELPPFHGDDKEIRPAAIARRKFLERTTGLVVVTGLAVGSSHKAKAAQKYSKDAVSYQDSPKGDQNCANCKFWDGEGGCEIVEGEISPDGWCAVWVAA